MKYLLQKRGCLKELSTKGVGINITFTAAYKQHTNSYTSSQSGVEGCYTGVATQYSRTSSSAKPAPRAKRMYRRSATSDLQQTVCPGAALRSSV